MRDSRIIMIKCSFFWLDNSKTNNLHKHSLNASVFMDNKMLMVHRCCISWVKNRLGILMEQVYDFIFAHTSRFLRLSVWDWGLFEGGLLPQALNNQCKAEMRFLLDYRLLKYYKESLGSIDVNYSLLWWIVAVFFSSFYYSGINWG